MSTRSLVPKLGNMRHDLQAEKANSPATTEGRVANLAYRDMALGFRLGGRVLHHDLR
jgi:hypothetical protein